MKIVKNVRYVSLLLFILVGTLCLLSCDGNQDTDKAPSIFWGLNISKSPLKPEVLKQELTGYTKTPSLISWHINWEYAFPKYDAEAVIKQGSIPQLIWEPWIWKDKEAIQFDNVIHGEWDTYISQFAKAVKQFNYPIFIQLAPCFNLEDVAWSTASLGKKGENYIEFYRHIVSQFQEEGVHNVMWVWAPYVESYPNRPWNSIHTAYPGDDVVDWIGLHGFNYGDNYTWSGWESVHDLYHPILSQLIQNYPDKPVMISSFATVMKSNKEKKVVKNGTLWLQSLTKTLQTSLSPVRAIMYDPNMTRFFLEPLDVDPSHKQHFQEMTENSYFASHSDTLNQLHIDYQTERHETPLFLNKKQDEINIDGDLSDWDEAGFISFTDLFFIRRGVMFWGGAQDMSLSLQASYDDDGIYISGLLSDDEAIKVKKGPLLTQSDAIQLHFYPKDEAVVSVGFSLNSDQNWSWETDAPLTASTQAMKTGPDGQVAFELFISKNDLRDWDRINYDQLLLYFTLYDADSSGKTELSNRYY